MVCSGAPRNCPVGRVGVGKSAVSPRNYPSDALKDWYEKFSGVILGEVWFYSPLVFSLEKGGCGDFFKNKRSKAWYISGTAQFGQCYACHLVHQNNPVIKPSLFSMAPGTSGESQEGLIKCGKTTALDDEKPSTHVRSWDHDRACGFQIDIHERFWITRIHPDVCLL